VSAWGSVKPRALCLVGDFFNLGDAFLAETQALHLASRGAPQVTVAPYQRPPEGMVAHFERRGLQVLAMRARPLAFLGECLRSDVFIGGGHAVREAISLGWLLLALIGCTLARWRGRRVLLVGAGVTPVKHRGKRMLWRAVLACCQALSVRDASSAQHLAALAPACVPRLRVSNDVAFLAELDAPPPAPARIVVVSPAIDPGEARDVDAPRIVRLLDALQRRGLLDEARFVAHDIRAQFDSDYCERLAEHVAHELRLPARVANGAIGSRLVDSYRDAALVVTGRLHGLIAGALLRKPVLYTGESARKLQPFGERFGFPCVRLDAEDWHAEVERVIAQVRRLDTTATDALLAHARREAGVNFE
jgi:polysaccharide pyruvyl transferase WcaK-like protein